VNPIGVPVQERFERGSVAACGAPRELVVDLITQA